MPWKEVRADLNRFEMKVLALGKRSAPKFYSGAEGDIDIRDLADQGMIISLGLLFSMFFLFITRAIT